MSDEVPKLRLKPRLIADTPSTPASIPSPAPATAAPSAASPAEAPSTAEPSPVPTEDSAPRPKILLRPKAASPQPPAPPLPVAAPPPPVAAPPPASATSLVSPPPLNATVATAAPPSIPSPPPGAEIQGGAPNEASAKSVQRAALGIGVAGVIVFTAIGWIAYPRVMKQVQELAAEESFGNGAEDTKEIEAEPDSPAPAPATTSAAATKSNSPAVTAPVPISPAAGQAKAEGATSDGTAEPDPNFRAWVNGLKISGVRGGAVPRVLIGGASFNQGDVVNAEMGVTFDSYDAQRHVLRFRDRAGTIVERRDR